MPTPVAVSKLPASVPGPVTLKVPPEGVAVSVRVFAHNDIDALLLVMLTMAPLLLPVTLKASVSSLIINLMSLTGRLARY